MFWVILQKIVARTVRFLHFFSLFLKVVSGLVNLPPVLHILLLPYCVLSEIPEARRQLSEKVRKNAKIGLSELQFFGK